MKRVPQSVPLLTAVLVSVALLCGAQLASADSPVAVADLVATVDGPTSGNVGDLLTYTVTVTNNGPDAVTYLPAYVSWSELAISTFATESNFDYVSDDSPPNRCGYIPASAGTSGPWRFQCTGYVTTPDNTYGSQPPGASFTVHVQLRVLATSSITTVCGGTDGGLLGIVVQQDPNTSNDERCFAFNGPSSSPPPSPPPPPPSGGGSPPAATFQFIDQIPRGEQWRPYYADLNACDYPPATCSYSVETTLAAGTLPPGVTLGPAAQLFGTPHTPGTYSFTVEAAQDFGSQGIAKIRHEYTIVVDPYRSTSGASTSPSPILPSRTRTPGVTNRAVTQKTIKTTICVSGWTKTVRPPASYTNMLKLKQMRQYGEMGVPSLYEEDQMIPLELGGAPRNPKNLWPEPHSQSKHTDPLETSLKRKVCAGTLTLAAARKQILTYKRKHG